MLYRLLETLDNGSCATSPTSHRSTTSTRLLCLVSLISAPPILGAQTTEAESQVTVQGTVESVDRAARTVTIRSQQGTVVTLDVPPNATRFDDLKAGAPVTATYYDRISVRVKPGG